MPVQVVYLTNTGGEANELAMMMSRLHTGNFDIISLRYLFVRVPVLCSFVDVVALELNNSKPHPHGIG